MITPKQIKHLEWIQVHNPTDDDRKVLHDQYKIRKGILNYALDIQERPRIETNPKQSYLLFIYDVPVTTRFSGDLSAEPISILVTKDRKLFTFTRTRSENTNNIVKKVIKNMMDDDQTEPQPEDVWNMLLEIFYQLTIPFSDHINRINAMRTNIQQNLSRKASRSEITQLLGLQTRIVYYLTSLTSNRELLTNIKRQFKDQLNETQLERVDDILVENNQELTMAQIASTVTQEVADAYSNLLDSSLNTTMKILTVFSILLTIPNIIFAFYGQNVNLPFANSPIAWELTIIISVIISLVIWWIYKKHWL
ncbi:magnesium transporter [Philodulcilactobacillus myokoensis]|uniref:Magnesium transporter n=1 Tax=Philodulcilactobacillus myokoensis TaxID=2929573 RepID=A0A9W6B0L0_9LACO|nr:magnesium transporter CorA family protein [Philodulcilactobacillus myokoensis]GLB46351.1 magnesium transporter [Philodulcilactobacillus myokoensis]